MALQKITIKEYKLEDTQDLAKIYYNTIHKVNIKHYTEEQVNVWAPDTSLEVSGWAKKFERTKPFVAIIDNMIVGFAEFEPDGHIDCFYCHHKWIGYGVGSALMQIIHENAIQKGIKLIFSEVSITALPFFKKYGFTTITEQTIVRQGVQLINYKMEKHLL